MDWLPDTVSATELHDTYIAQNRPFILGPGHTDSWPATSRWTAEGLTSLYAGIAVNVSRSSTHLWQTLVPDQYHIELVARGTTTQNHPPKKPKDRSCAPSLAARFRQRHRSRDGACALCGAARHLVLNGALLAAMCRICNFRRHRISAGRLELDGLDGARVVR